MTAREWGQLLLSIPCALLFTLVLHRLTGIRRPWRWRFILFVGCLLISGIPIYVGDAINILGVLPVFFGCVWFCCEGSGAARASMALILFPVAMSMSAVVDTVMLRSVPFARLGVKTLLWLSIWLVIRRLVPEELPALRNHLWALIDILATLPLLTVVCIVALGDARKDLELSEWILLPICTVVSIALLFAVVLLTRQEKMEREHRLFQMRNLYYENLEREQWQVRRLRHDMANHLQTMAALDNTAAHTYLRDLMQSPGISTSPHFCESKVADTVLCSKAAHMESLGIRFDCHVDIPHTLPLKDPDLCAVLANSLDNAIEACAPLPEGQRWIVLDAAVCKGLFALEVRNPLLAPPQTAGGKVVSHKWDRSRHGFGLASIREIANRYHGTLQYGHQDGIFTLLFSMLTEAPTTRNLSQADSPRPPLSSPYTPIS